ncbi:Histone-lysine n-methyltransferase atx2 [Thalictrum thalictroides]|uniref:Histone-lysine n-methyltransferase atx2 n=1 Tax=Thalictrum thalictroides TaxID=46969 RepID=A0A7J6XEY1_THATH|nr:Histone-lysine n-methyltransferase atx2 [Thalictrum thalictroides]
MMVHARCYSEVKPVDGYYGRFLKLGIDLLGCAMKPTTDGRWAHLVCAIWIPDIQRMEPIDGLSRINKVKAFHIIHCAAGLCVELEDKNKLHLRSFDEDDEDQCIRLFSYHKKYKKPSNECSPSDDQLRPVFRHCSNCVFPSNPSGCAHSGRRVRKPLESDEHLVIEYTGELVRSSVADRREHFIYNSLVGAGTYMFRMEMSL